MCRLVSPFASLARARAHKVMATDKSELMNRPAFGVGFASGSLYAMLLATKSGVTAGLFSQAFADKVSTLLEHPEHDIKSINRLLNSHDHPEIPREPHDVLQAVKQLLALAAKVQDDWSRP